MAQIHAPRAAHVDARPSLASRILGSDVFPGVLLLTAAALALVWANSPAHALYQGVWSTPVTLGLGEFSLTKALILWINDGLMAVFFLLVGLEIKREVVEGQLSSLRRAALPLAAAVGGMAVPAIFYMAFNVGGEGARGWGIPMATDIAFALGVLAMVGSRAPLALKIFLTAVAVVDDLGAVAVIALFYTAEISTVALGVGAGVLLALVALNRSGVRALSPYLLLGAILWVAILKSGVHATVAGVLLALTIPAGRRDGTSPLVRLEHALHPGVIFFIVPVFALANAGVRVVGEGGPSLLDPVSMGVMVGLLLGKPLGVLGMAWVAIRTGLAERPAGVGWSHLTAAALLSGIGFTMSLFIGQLAFGTGPLLEAAKVGVLSASTVSALGAWLILRRSAHTVATAGPSAAGPGSDGGLRVDGEAQGRPQGPSRSHPTHGRAQDLPAAGAHA